MNYPNVVVKKLEAIFGAQALEPRLALTIMTFVESHREGVHHLNLASVKQFCKLQNNVEVDVQVLKTLQVLAGDAVGYLNVGFEYVDSNEEIHNISRFEFISAIEDGIDPISGELSEDLAERVLIFYFPDSTFPKRLLQQ